jgi:hypothetical protein
METTEKPTATEKDVKALCSALTIQHQSYMRKKLDANHTTLGQEDLIAVMAELAFRILYKHFADLSNDMRDEVRHCMRDHVYSFVQEYYSV